jgi:anti-anti-sigma factor
MKPEPRKTVRASLYTDAAVSIVRLAAAEYGSLDAEKLTRVRGLLLDQADKPGPPYLVLDLSAVHFLGASFIGILVSAWDRLRKRNRKFVLCGLRPYCSKLIQTLRLDKLFQIYPTQRIALEEIGWNLRSCEWVAPSPGVRIQKSEVAWNPDMVRLEYIGEDNVPIRSLIVPRTEASC